VRSPSALNDTALLNGSVVKSDDVSDRLLIALSTVHPLLGTKLFHQVKCMDDRSAVHEDILNKDQNPQYYLPPEHHGATEHNQKQRIYWICGWAAVSSFKLKAFGTNQPLKHTKISSTTCTPSLRSESIVVV